MADSTSFTSTGTFTLTHARHMAAKVATDLKRVQRFYDSPSDHEIAQYEAEVTELLKHGYLDHIAYGFKRNGNWIEPTLRYRARDLAGGAANDDDPGRVKPGCDVSGAQFCSFLVYSTNWAAASPYEKEDFRKRLPFRRGDGSEPGVTGYVVKDRIYSSGGRALDRETIRSIP